MKYQDIKPSVELEPYIHSFWELKGEVNDSQWERTFLMVALGWLLIWENPAGLIMA